MNRTEIFNKNKSMAYKLAYKYSAVANAKGIHTDDLIQEALLSLWDTIPKWDPSKAKLSTLYFKNGKRHLSYYINKPEHYDMYHMEKKPSGNSFRYYRRSAAYAEGQPYGSGDGEETELTNYNLTTARASSSSDVSSNLMGVDPNTPSEALEASLTADSVLSWVMGRDYTLDAVTAFLGVVEGYNYSELSKLIGLPKASLHHRVTKIRKDLMEHFDYTPEPENWCPVKKVCTKCGDEKPLYEFTAHIRTADKRHTQCKACHAAYRKIGYTDRDCA